MSNSRQKWIVLWCLSLSLSLPMMAAAQNAASLKTMETELKLEAGAAFPRLVTMQGGAVRWNNGAAEKLISEIEVAGESKPLAWKFNVAESRVKRDRINFVYDAVSPNLHLNWE